MKIESNRLTEFFTLGPFKITAKYQIKIHSKSGTLRMPST